MFALKDKENIIQRIQEFLLHKEERRVRRALRDIMERNAPYSGTYHCFVLQGKIITDGSKEARSAPKKPLHASLVEEAKTLIQQQEVFAQHRQQVRNFLTVLFPYCTCLQDLRDVFPEDLIEKGILWELFGFSRTRPPGYPFLNQPVKMRMFRENIALFTLYEFYETVK